MRVPSSVQTRRAARINLTPLIDIIFNLIIFFLAAAHFARSEPVEDVELPVANPRESQEKTPRQMVVTVTAGPKFIVGSQVQPREVVLAMIEAEGSGRESTPLELRIRSDRSIPFGEIEPLLVAAAKAGVTDVKFPVIRPENEAD